MKLSKPTKYALICFGLFLLAGYVDPILLSMGL